MRFLVLVTALAAGCDVSTVGDDLEQADVDWGDDDDGSTTTSSLVARPSQTGDLMVWTVNLHWNHDVEPGQRIGSFFDRLASRDVARDPDLLLVQELSDRHVG